MRGRAVPTTVWSKEARNMVSRIAPRIVNFARGANDISDGAVALGSVTTSCAAAGRRSSTVAIFLSFASLLARSSAHAATFAQAAATGPSATWTWGFETT